MGVLTTTGYTPYFYDYYKDYLIDDLKEKYPNMSTLDTNPLIIECKSLAELLARLDSLNLDIYNSRAIKTANGYALEKLVSIVGMTRRGASSATGIVKFSGVDGSVIPEGTQVKSNDNIVFYTDTVVTIASGIAQVNVTSAEVGTKSNVDSGTVIIIPFPIAGVNSVTNELPFTNAKDIETDPELRDRYFYQLFQTNKSTIEAISTALFNVENVSKVDVVENPTHLFVDGDNPHSIHIYVHGGSNQDIYNSIFDTRAGGCAYCMGDNVQNIEYRGGTYRVAFDRFDNQAITYQVTVQKNPDKWENSYEQDIKNDIIDAVNNGVLINREFTFSILLNATYKNRSEAIYDIELFQWTIDGSANKTYGDKVTILRGQSVSIQESDIIVNII